MAAFDFPSNPTTGEIYSPGTGTSYRWDGSKWKILPADDVQSLGDLDDVDIAGAQNGHFLQYNSATSEWTPVAVAPGSGIGEAPQDGNYYVRQNSTWINLRSALSALGINTDVIIDGGNFTTGSTSATDSSIPDGGNFTTGVTSATNSDTYDGGAITGTNISGETIDGGYWS